ncbi:MAG: hypothetical protein MUP81_00175 [Dehalococcoidia bacterium]|nr:hypothetical protein [Dehalococcoidia bacterium]
MTNEAIEKKEHIKHTEQLVSFWQGKLDHDDCNLIGPTSRLLIRDTVQCLKEWAGRFIHGVEFRCSDSEGKDILREMEVEAMTNREKIAFQLRLVDHCHNYHNSANIQTWANYLNTATEILKDLESLGYVPPDKVFKITGRELEEYFIDVSALEGWAKSRGYRRIVEDQGLPEITIPSHSRTMVCMHCGDEFGYEDTAQTEQQIAQQNMLTPDKNGCVWVKVKELK